MHPLSNTMVSIRLEPKTYQFHSREKDEKVLGHEVPYQSAIGALMYFLQCTRLDISFAINFLTRYSSEPTWRHYNKVKNNFCYLSGNKNIRLLY